MSRFSAIARVPTAQGSKYLQQLCKHWQHNLNVEFDAGQGRVIFPRDVKGADHPGDGIATMTAGADVLAVRIDATSDAQLTGLKGVLESHLDRFAFREAPLGFDWQEAD